MIVRASFTTADAFLRASKLALFLLPLANAEELEDAAELLANGRPPSMAAESTSCASLAVTVIFCSSDMWSSIVEYTDMRLRICQANVKRRCQLCLSLQALSPPYVCTRERGEVSRYR